MNVAWIEVRFSDGKVYRVGAGVIAMHYAVRVSEGKNKSELKKIADEFLKNPKEFLKYATENVSWSEILSNAIGYQSPIMTDYVKEWKSPDEKYLIGEDDKTILLPEISAEACQLTAESDKDLIKELQEQLKEITGKYNELIEKYNKPIPNIDPGSPIGSSLSGGCTHTCDGVTTSMSHDHSSIGNASKVKRKYTKRK